MENSKVMGRSRPFRIKTLRGEPYVVAERRLTPLARVVSWGKAQATVGTGRVTGWGTGFARIIPLAVLVETEEGVERIPITDRTATAVRAMLLAAVISTLFFATIRWLVRHQSGTRVEKAPFEEIGQGVNHEFESTI